MEYQENSNRVRIPIPPTTTTNALKLRNRPENELLVPDIVLFITSFSFSLHCKTLLLQSISLKQKQNEIFIETVDPPVLMSRFTSSLTNFLQKRLKVVQVNEHFSFNVQCSYRLLQNEKFPESLV